MCEKMICPKCSSDNLHLAKDCTSGMCTGNGCHNCGYGWNNG